MIASIPPEFKVSIKTLTSLTAFTLASLISLVKGDEMIGFDIDMTKELFAIMKENGDDYEYEFKKLSFDTISTSLIKSAVHLILFTDLPPSSARLET